jgi:hypothetical protein
MSRERVPPEKRHRARLLAGVFFREPVQRRGGVVRVFLLIGGVALILIGLALVVLPVVPGFPLVIVGMLMLAAGSAWVRGRLNGLERRLPTGIRARLRRLARQEHEFLERRMHPNAHGEDPGSNRNPHGDGHGNAAPKPDAADPSPR